MKGKVAFCYVRMAEWSKAPDSSVKAYLRKYVSGVECSGPRMWAWVRIPLLTQELFLSFPTRKRDTECELSIWRLSHFNPTKFDANDKVPFKGGDSPG